MLRDKNFSLRGLVTVLLATGLLGVAVWSSVHAAPVKDPVPQDAASDTPTDTLIPTQTDTPTDTLAPTDTPTASMTPDFTGTPSDTSIPTQSSTPTNTATQPSRTPSAPDHIVISQFRTIGPSGANDQFVELFNPTGAAVNIGGWMINMSSGCGAAIQTLVNIPSGIILQPGQHYLVAYTDNSLPTAEAPDNTFTTRIDDYGGLALVNSSSSVDVVGMCAGTTYHEGIYLQSMVITPLPGTPTPTPGASDQSYERKPLGNPGCYDTDDNANDFTLISPADPQNQSSDAVMCAGVVLSTLTRTPTITPTLTRTPTRVPTALPGVVVINEFLPHPHSDWNGDGTANDGDEYIEIINVGSNALDVKGWKLDTGLGSIKTFTLPEMILQSRQIAAFYGSQTGLSLSDGGGTVRLLRTDGRIADAYTYPAVETADLAWCRLPDGNGVWGFSCHPSPGRPNISINTTTPGFVPGDAAICRLANSVPQAMILAECGSYGSGIANSLGEKPFWLESRWKWEVFVE